MHTRRQAAVTAALVGVLTPGLAAAFCGFYVSGSSEQLTNKATRVALMRQGTRTVLTMSNDYEGPAQDFAMVVPVPVVLQQENVRTLPHDVFAHIESLTAPRLVEYWEQDPCFVPRPMRYRMAPRAGAMPGASAVERDTDEGGVRIEARFTVGEYNVLVLSATESTGLETWLRAHHYNIPNGAAEALAPYVRDQWKFFVARVDIARAERRPTGGVRLSPLRFHYDSPEFRLPVRLGLLNAPAAQDLLVYVVHPTSRFEVANYANAFVPTNLDVTDGVRSRFGEFYARLFDYTLDAAGGRAVVTEYAWSTGFCDPCPTPPLSPSELNVLGADVLGGSDAAYHGNQMVVTRLHTRYNRATLTEDLVFREAGPVVGGRENGGPGGRIEQGASPSSTNNFQARYAIRHPWTGPVRCAHPVRGRWGGPPGGVTPRPTAARDLSDAPRRGLNLRANLRSPLPTVRAVNAPPGAPTAPPRRSEGPSTPARQAAGGLGIAGMLAAALRRLRG